MTVINSKWTSSRELIKAWAKNKIGNHRIDQVRWIGMPIVRSTVKPRKYMWVATKLIEIKFKTKIWGQFHTWLITNSKGQGKEIVHTLKIFMERRYEKTEKYRSYWSLKLRCRKWVKEKLTNKRSWQRISCENR